MKHVELVIIGQGLAGSALAWEAIRQGVSAHVIDRGDAVTCSRIAAGLMMPVTGKRLAKSWGWDEFWPSAVEFYREVEQRTGVDCLRNSEALRLLRSEQERRQLELRLSQEEFVGWIEALTPQQIPRGFRAPWGGFRLLESGRLDTNAFLNASRREFISREMYLSGDVQVPHELEVTDTEVRLPRWNITASRVVLCRGFEGHVDPFFQGVCWNPAHGEIATVRIPGLNLQSIVQFGHWLVPVSQNNYLLGATFSWDRRTAGGTPHGREQLEAALAEVLHVPADLLDVQGAVRPTLCDYRPIIGERESDSRVSIFNGLGTKGSLMAPLLARTLFDSWDQGGTIPAAVDVRRWFR